MSSSRIATLDRGARFWAVAAIHGEATRLARIHDAIWEHLEPGDRVVYLGNLIGRGPEIRATLDELLDFRRAVIGAPGGFACDVVYLRGAQEVMWQQLLQLQFTPDPGGALDWMLPRGVRETLQAYGADPESGLRAARAGTVALTKWTGEVRRLMQSNPGHHELLGRLRNAAHTGPGGALFVNAGLDPKRPLERQADLFWWHGGGFARMAAAYADFARVVRGYDPADGEPVEAPHKLSLDKGAGRGGPLQAACLDREGQLLGRVEG
jgi:serine/threonine protein phosphatase 1